MRLPFFLSLSPEFLDDERYFPWSEMYNVEVACFAVKRGRDGLACV